MACSNCYNNCSEITSDKCVKYTGIDVPALGIQTGDSLSFVEQALITFLTAVIDGSGITITLDEADYCELVTQYLQECSTVTALDLFKALVKAACDLQTQIDTINTTLETLNADYDVDCLEGVTDSSDTHAVVQAIIVKLCAIDVSLTALALDLDTNYVKIADINSYIAAYLESIAPADRYYLRMVPYTVVEYYGSLSNFDGTGAGIPDTAWEKIYLCNGNNGTPDKRGRVAVGAIDGVPGGILPSDVNPGSSSFNPNYAILDTVGANSITLTSSQIPAHTHPAASTATVTPNPHSHTITGTPGDDTGSGAVVARDPGAGESAGSTNTTSLAVAVSTAVAANTGDEAHSNIQPVKACYYIMYLP